MTTSYAEDAPQEEQPEEVEEFGSLTDDVTSEPELPLPEDFDLDSWVRGVQATVRTVNFYQRADLIGQIEELEGRLQIARLAEQDEGEESGMEEGSESAALEAQLRDLQKKFVDSGVTFRIEGRSETRLAAIEKEWAGRADTHGKTKDEKMVFVRMHQLADAIVAPAGVTYEHLAALREASEAQVRKLLVAFGYACGQAPSVSVPTSPQSSAARRGRRR